MTRKRLEWRLKERSLLLGERTLLVAEMVLTPDAPAAGGRYDDPDRAFARAIDLEEQGADVLEITAEVLRPGAARVSEAEEMRRLIPALKRLRGKLSVAVSVRTYKAAVAERALELGAEIVNDPSGLTFDPQLARAAVQADAGLVLGHTRGTPDTWAKLPPARDAAGSVRLELESSVHRAVRAGVERSRIAVDPGLGLGKRREQNAEILARLGELARLDLPLQVCPAPENFLKEVTSPEAGFVEAAGVTAAILGGASLVRVQDVKAARLVAAVADAVLAAAA